MAQYEINACWCGHKTCNYFSVDGPGTSFDQGTGFVGQELAQSVADFLNGDVAAKHDARVTGLIRACSTEVIQRRFYHAALKIALGALTKISLEEYYSAKSPGDPRPATLALEQMDKLKPEDFGRP